MKFENYKIKKEIIKVLENNKLSNMTDVQESVIPHILRNKKVIVSAPSGSGKTLAFIIPLINELDLTSNSIQGMILAPTAELSQQILGVLRIFSKVLNFKVDNIDNSYEYKNGNNLPKIIVGTPGKTLHSYKNHKFPITTIKTLVLDEVDMIIDLGFLKEIEEIVYKSNNNIMIHSYSATIPVELQNFIKKYFKGNIEKIVLKETVEGNNVSHSFINLKEQKPIDYIEREILSSNFNPYMGLIFAFDKTEAETLYRRLISKGIKDVALISSDNEKRQRISIMKRIANNEFQYIIATDVASRGIDIEGLSHVVHLGVPYDINYYVHRCGRTGRFMSKGESLLLIRKEQMSEVRKISAKYSINFKQIPYKILSTK